MNLKYSDPGTDLASPENGGGDSVRPDTNRSTRRIGNDNNVFVQPRLEKQQLTQKPPHVVETTGTAKSSSNCPISTQAPSMETYRKPALGLSVSETRQEKDANDSDHYDFPKDYQDFPTALKADSKQQRIPPPERSQPDSRPRSRTPSQQVSRSEMISLRRSLSDIASKKHWRSCLIDSSAGKSRMNQTTYEKMPTTIGEKDMTSSEIQRDEVPVALSLASHGVLCLKQGRLVEARQAFVDALALKRKLAPGLMVADILNNLGNCANLMGLHEESLDY